MLRGNEKGPWYQLCEKWELKVVENRNDIDKTCHPAKAFASDKVWKRRENREEQYSARFTKVTSVTLRADL